MSPTRPRILLIDDDPDFGQDLSALMGGDFSFAFADTRAAAVEALLRSRPDAVLLDIDLGGESGMDLLVELRKREDAPPVIMMTGDRRLASAVEAVRLGACDYLTKPPVRDDVSRVIRRALADEALRRRLDSLERDLADVHGEIVTDDPVMLTLLDHLARVAATDASVLVTGESGTGKELVARRLHDLSGRRTGPFVALNCAAIPAELIESELFGHEKGAFTGATALKLGAFELARGGTLFMDELGDSPPALQAKLLRALEDRTFRRVGGSATLQADVRIVAATSLEPEHMIDRGELRKELYYRLNVVRLRLPPLRERPGDVRRLAHHFLSLFTTRIGKPIRGFTPSAERVLLDRHWPGNVRELRNVVERAVILGDGPLLDAAQVAEADGSGDAPILDYEDAKTRALERFKRTYLTARLMEAEGNVSRAAEASGLKRQSFGRMCAEVGLSAEVFRSRDPD